LTRRTAY